MTTIFKIITSPDYDYVALLTLEGDVIYLDSEKNKMVDKINFNTFKELPGGESIKYENCVVNLGFCFDYVEPLSKKSKSNINKRKFKKNASLMAITNSKFCEYLFTDHCKTYEKTLDSSWENLLILQNYRYDFYIFKMILNNLAEIISSLQPPNHTVFR
jgi:hypothetical protein